MILSMYNIHIGINVLNAEKFNTINLNIFFILLLVEWNDSISLRTNNNNEIIVEHGSGNDQKSEIYKKN